MFRISASSSYALTVWELGAGACLGVEELLSE